MEILRNVFNSRKTVLITIAFLLLLGATPQAFANNEVLIGHYSCKLNDDGSIWHDVSFKASGDATIALDDFYKSHSGISTDDCIHRANAMQAVAVNQGCSVDQINYNPNSWDYNYDFHFVCKGKRDNIINVISAMSTEIISPTIINSN